VCPGRSLALLEARVALATLFRNFDVERSSGPVAERYTSILVPSGLSVRLARPRALA
jgi:cytochrome P450